MLEAVILGSSFYYKDTALASAILDRDYLRMMSGTHRSMIRRGLFSRFPGDVEDVAHSQGQV